MKTITRTRIVWSLVVLLMPVASAWARQDQPPPPQLTEKTLAELMGVKVESVYGASKQDQPVTDAPSSVTIITADDILTFGWRTLADVLKNVRGFHVTNDRNYSYIGARGFGRPSDYNNRVLVLVDGHRFNDNVYDAASIGDDFSLGVDLIDRIEIIRGPGSALYGGSAFFGVINVITRRGGAVAPVELDVEAGTLGTYGGRATTGWTRPGIDALFSVTGTTSDGVSALYYPEYDTDATNHGRSFDLDGSWATSIFGTVTMKDVTIQGLFGAREKYLPTGSYGTTFGDERNRTVDSRGWIDVSRRFTVGATSVNARASYDRMNYEGTYIYHDGATINRDFARGDWVTGEVMVTRAIGQRYVLSGGTEYRGNLVQDQWAFNEPEPDARTIDADYSSHQLGLYGQAAIAIHPKLTATVGGRYDRWSLIGGSGRPRLGLVLTPAVNTAVKFLYGGAYRAPNLFELFYYGGDEPSPVRLKPESLKTAEAVFERYFGGRLRITATAFVTDITNLITQTADADGQLSFQNQDRARAKGAEMEAEARSPQGVLLRGNLVFQRVRDEATGRELTNAPRRLAVINAAVPLADRRVTLAMDANYVGPRLTRGGEELEGVWVVNANAVWRRRGSGLTFSVGIANLLDTAYSHPVGAEFVQEAIAQNGRTALARVAVKF
jgi:outer membrane receptor for ferrienterochelin and colicins